MKKSLNILLSPPFLTSLALLLINDFFLKDYFHNFLTGKLSDFAGLFAFALFWTVFFPKWKALIFSLVVVAFTFWKSPFSSGFIEWWNSIGLFAISRTVDYTDLIAFTILPLAWFGEKNYAPIRVPKFSQNFALVMIALISVFAFTATSQPREDEEHYRFTEYNDVYTVEKSPIETLKKLQDFPAEEFSQSRGENRDGTTIGLSLKENFCDNKPYFYFEIHNENNKSQIRLKSVSYKCKELNPQQKEWLKTIFEKQVIVFLKS